MSYRWVAKYLPDMFDGLMEIQESIGTEKQDEVIKNIFETFTKISIDYGVMEKADNVLCMKAKYTWDDVGAWTALSRVTKSDENNNLIKSDWKGIDTKNSIILNDKGFIATIGVDNLVVIKDGDSILIADKAREQEVKQIVKELKEDEELIKYIQ